MLNLFNKDFYFPTIGVQYVENDIVNTVFHVTVRYYEPSKDEYGTLFMFASGPTTQEISASLPNKEVMPGVFITEIIEIKSLVECLQTLEQAMSDAQVLM